MSIILLRNDLYLNNRYQWVSIPDLFPDWHAPVVFSVMTDPRNPTPPTGWAIVDGAQTIDLDALEVRTF